MGGIGGLSAIGGGVATGKGGMIGSGGVTSIGGKSGSGGTTVVGGAGGPPPTGGVVSTGGATICSPTKATGLYPLIDDVADGNTDIVPQDGRRGGWYTYSDNTGTISLAAPTSGKMCASGSGFSVWGAELGVNLNAVPTKTCTYDASIYKGISFNVDFTVSNGIMHFVVQTADIASVAAGGTCVSTTGALSDRCDDAYGIDLPLSAKMVIPFSYMTQQGWGRVFPTFNPKLILALQWQFKNCVGAFCYTSGTSFDVCVSNVSFY